VRADFFKCDLDLPAAHEPGQDVLGAGVEICRQECLGIELALGVADEEPADRHRRNSGTIPKCCPAGDLDEPIGSTVPETDAAALPLHLGILEDGGELPQSLALDRRPTAAFAFWRRKGKQVGVEPQSCDDTDILAHRSEELDSRECTIGDQDNIAVGKPAADLQSGLSRPVDQRLGGSQFACVEALRGCEHREEG
jgi:hypothetical protein